MRATVVVVTTAGHPTLLESRYVIRYIADYWRERGIHFELTTNPGLAPRGDVAWQHLDMTTVAADYQRLLSRYPVVINGGPSDVHKHRTASHLVTRDDEWDGPVIVKTDLNFGGRAEDWGYRWRVMRHPWFHAMRNRLPVPLTGRIEPEAYPLFSCKSEVSGWMWRDRRLVVQRFLAEREGNRYGIRRWFFFGTSEFAYLAYATRPIILGDDHAEWVRLEKLPEALRALRAKFGLDFGKIDYGEVDGQLVVYDINPAVSADGPVDSRLQREMVAALTPGLESFLESAGR